MTLREAWAPDPQGWKIGILWIDNASLVSVYGAYEDFVSANHVTQVEDEYDGRGFRVSILSESGVPERGLMGALVSPDCRFDATGPWDALIVPAVMDEGSLSAPASGTDYYPESLKHLLRLHLESGGLVAGLCTASFLLAEAGLLDGDRATTHWLYEDTFRERFPKVEVVPSRRVLRAGPGGRIIMGGASAYMTDVILPVISSFAGVDFTREFARRFGKFWHDDPREEHAERIERPHSEDSAVSVAVAWLRERACSGGTVGGAAEHVNLNERTFTRRFRKAQGMSPADFIRNMKVERARELLERSRIPADEVAARVGYADPAAFHRAFKKETGMSPGAYRRQFKLPPAPV
ncbi:MAG: helix-turn-helix domain-containing protein [Myxococcota bacterium]